MVDVYLSRSGAGGPFDPLVLGLSDSDTFAWTVTGPATAGVDAILRVVARDPAQNMGQDESDAPFQIIP